MYGMGERITGSRAASLEDLPSEPAQSLSKGQRLSPCLRSEPASAGGGSSPSHRCPRPGFEHRETQGNPASNTCGCPIQAGFAWVGFFVCCAMAVSQT